MDCADEDNRVIACPEVFTCLLLATEKEGKGEKENDPHATQEEIMSFILCRPLHCIKFCPAILDDSYFS